MWGRLLLWKSMTTRLIAAFILLAGSLFLPFLTFAAIPPAGDTPSDAQDACKTGETQIRPGSTNPMGTAIVGGVETNNYIVVTKNLVTVGCRKTPLGEDSTVMICGLHGSCATYSKKSLQGQNLMEIFREAQHGGTVSQLGMYTISPQDLTQRLLDTTSYKKAEDIVDNMINPYGGLISHGHILDAITGYASRETIVASNARDSARQAIEEMAEDSQRVPTQNVQPFPSRYPPSWNLSLQAGLHDAFAVRHQGPPLTGVDPQVYTVPAQSAQTTFQEKWSSVSITSSLEPLNFESLWKERIGLAAPKTLYERLIDIVSRFRF